MTLQTPISTCEYDTRIVRRGDSVLLISCPCANDPDAKHLEITFTPHEAETVGAELIEAARGQVRARA